MSKTTLKKDNSVALERFETYSESTVIRAVQYWSKNSQVDQQNTIKGSEINAIIYGFMHFVGEGQAETIGNS